MWIEYLVARRCAPPTHSALPAPPHFSPAPPLSPPPSRSRHRPLAPVVRAAPRLAGSSANSQDGGERRRSGHRPGARTDLAGDPEHRHRLRGAHPPVTLSFSRDLGLSPPPPVAHQEPGGASAAGSALGGPTGGARGGGRGRCGTAGWDLRGDLGRAAPAATPVSAVRLSLGSCHRAAGGCGSHGSSDPGSPGSAPPSPPRLHRPVPASVSRTRLGPLALRWRWDGGRLGHGRARGEG